MSLFTLQQKIEEIILLQSMEILCDIEIGKAAFQSLPLQLRANQSLGKVGRVLYAEEIAEELQIGNAAVLRIHVYLDFSAALKAAALFYAVGGRKAVIPFPLIIAFLFDFFDFSQLLCGEYIGLNIFFFQNVF